MKSNKTIKNHALVTLVTIVFGVAVMKDVLRRIAVGIVILQVMLIVAAPIVPVTQAVTLPNNVVINEFEQYAVGGDLNRQWVEIYNPTSAPVNIGNWKILVASGTTKTIPADTFVPANGYYVHMFTGIVLKHTNEMITLKDASNNVVDVTAKKSSTTASTSTWQRYPNGVDTNSDGDWQFREGTKWKSNRGETVTMSISSSSITLGSDATLSGTVDPGHVTLVRIQASLDGGASWVNVTIVSSTSTGAYSYVIVKPDVGSYLFRAVLLYVSGVLSGTVSLTVNKAPSTINVFAPKTITIRESASLIGFISPIKPSVSVTLTIGMPNGTYTTRSTTTNTAGYFNYTFAPDDEGRWNVTASWGGDGTTQGATSSIAFFTVKSEDQWVLTLALLIVVPVAVLLIVLGLTLSRGPRRRVVPLFRPVRRLRPLVPGRLIGWRPRILPARICPKCRGQLIYASQYRKWYCPRCRHYA